MIIGRVVVSATVGLLLSTSVHAAPVQLRCTGAIKAFGGESIMSFTLAVDVDGRSVMMKYPDKPPTTLKDETTEDGHKSRVVIDEDSVRVIITQKNNSRADEFFLLDRNSGAFHFGEMVDDKNSWFKLSAVRFNCVPFQKVLP